MQIVPEHDFRTWLRAGGIAPHSRWGNTDTLVFLEEPDLSRFWFPSFVPSDLPGFLSTALYAASDSGPWYVMRRGGGSWYDAEADATPDPNLIINSLLRAAGVPESASGALKFAHSDWKSLSIVALAHYVYGWGVGEDLHMFGERRDCAMMISHHGELAVHFPSMERLDNFRSAMLEEGYDLPTELPDETFKSPDWLKARSRRGRPNNPR